MNRQPDVLNLNDPRSQESISVSFPYVPKAPLRVSYLAINRPPGLDSSIVIMATIIPNTEIAVFETHRDHVTDERTAFLYDIQTGSHEQFSAKGIDTRSVKLLTSADQSRKVASFPVWFEGDFAGHLLLDLETNEKFYVGISSDDGPREPLPQVWLFPRGDSRVGLVAQGTNHNTKLISVRGEPFSVPPSSSIAISSAGEVRYITNVSDDPAHPEYVLCDEKGPVDGISGLTLQSKTVAVSPKGNFLPVVAFDSPFGERLPIYLVDPGMDSAPERLGSGLPRLRGETHISSDGSIALTIVKTNHDQSLVLDTRSGSPIHIFEGGKLEVHFSKNSCNALLVNAEEVGESTRFTVITYPALNTYVGTLPTSGRFHLVQGGADYPEGVILFQGRANSGGLDFVDFVTGRLFAVEKGADYEINHLYTDRSSQDGRTFLSISSSPWEDCEILDLHNEDVLSRLFSDHPTFYSSADGRVQIAVGKGLGEHPRLEKVYDLNNKSFILEGDYYSHFHRTEDGGLFCIRTLARNNNLSDIVKISPE